MFKRAAFPEAVMLWVAFAFGFAAVALIIGGLMQRALDAVASSPLEPRRAWLERKLDIHPPAIPERRKRRRV